MLVALARYDLRLPGCRSLKAKRHVIKALTSEIRSTFQASVAEVEFQDLWQRAAIAVAVVGAQEYHLRTVLGRVDDVIDRVAEVELLHRDVSVMSPED